MIFVPAYYAETTIESVIDRIPEDVFQEVAEILIQDDASQDNTYMIAQQIAQSNDKVVAVKNEKNLGYGGTLKKAYLYAIDKGYDAVIMIHGDGQLPPEYIQDVLAPIRDKKADIVLGSRILGDPLGGGMPVHKFWANKFLTWLMNLSLKQDLTDYHTGYVAITTQALRKIDIGQCKNGHEITPEMLIKAIRAGLIVEDVPVPTSYGEGSRSVNLKTSVKYSFAIIKMLINRNLSS